MARGKSSNSSSKSKSTSSSSKQSRSTKQNSSNKRSVSGSKQAVESMKYEIAKEFGVSLGADATAKANGTVGGEMTKRLVERGKTGMSNSRSSSSNN